MPQSNFVNTNVETILDTYTKVELSLDTNSPAQPGNYCDHMEIVGTPTNAPASLTWWLTYDTAGADPAHGPVTTSLAAVPSGTPLGFTATVDKYLAWNRAGRNAGTLFLWAKTDGATKTLGLTALTGAVVVMRDSRAC
jgi:hypothetical protein